MLVEPTVYVLFLMLMADPARFQWEDLPCQLREYVELEA